MFSLLELPILAAADNYWELKSIIVSSTSEQITSVHWRAMKIGNTETQEQVEEYITNIITLTSLPQQTQTICVWDQNLTMLTHKV